MNNLWLLSIAAVAAVALFFAWRSQRCAQRYRQRVTALKDELAALQAAQQRPDRLDPLFSSLHEAVLRLDGDGRVLAANAAALNAFAICADNLPKSLAHFYRDSDWFAQFRAALTAPAGEAQALPNIKLNGYVLSPRLSQLAQGHFLLLCLDITAQHRLEKQRRLFLSNLMHDLKTPLTSLLGYARSLESFGDDAEFRAEAVAVIANEAKHVNQLLDALLRLDQVEYKQSDRAAACAPAPLVAKVAEMLKPQCAERNLRLTLQVAEDARQICMDAMDFDRVITNLLSNALRYSPEGGEVTLTLSWQAAHCSVVIEDAGEGIPEKYLPRVTERFFRVDKARSRGVEGHGLGLAIVKALVESADGELTLRNREPHGLRAAVLLPAKVD